MAKQDGQERGRFDRLEIYVQRRELRVDGIPVPLGGRAFDILHVLVEASGAVVTKSDLMQRVWPNVFVTDNALQVHVSAIRQALGRNRALLKTVSRRGYRLVGDWAFGDSAAPPEPPAPELTAASTNLPAIMLDTVGRAESVAMLRAACSAYRVVTLTGPGGIGKTTLAIELAHSLLPEFDAGVRLVELASLSDPTLLPLAVADALGMHPGGGTVSAETVARHISGSRLLLVLDNCEHLINAAADFAERLVRLSPRIVILATSREALRTNGECVYQVPPLEVPQHGSDQASVFLGSSAVQLFLDRVNALHSPDLREISNLRLIADICRHLDGIPLAIEFAAARASSLGLSQTAAGLGDRFALLTTGRRTALPRHQTLRAVFDWSYALLSEAERLLLHRLAIFSGGFSLDAVGAVMSNSSRAEIADGIVGLTEKSMIAVDTAIPDGRWRLLETVRAYALGKLIGQGDLQSVSRRHAEYFRDLFASFDPDTDLQDGSDELQRYARDVDNLRAALSWAFSTAGDAVLATSLTAAAVNFWLAVSQLDECSRWTGSALAISDGTANDEQEMVLRSALGLSSMFVEGMTPATHANLTRALAIAEARGDIEQQMRALHGLWRFSTRSMELREALRLSQRFAALARSANPSEMNTAHQIVGMSLTYLGEYSEATSLLERAMHDYPVAQRYRDQVRLGVDPPSTVFLRLALCQFPRGRIDTAIQAAERSIDEARQIGQPVPFCIALLWTGATLLPEVGAFEAADRHNATMLEQADRYALETFRALGVCANGRVLSARGDPSTGATALRSGLEQLKKAGHRLFHTIFRGYLAEALVEAGHADEGLAEAEAALFSAEQMDYMRFVPELLRIRGSALTRRQIDDGAAEQMFRRAIDVARRQGALYWELSAALCLAEFWQPQGRDAEARALLAPICQGFTEGLATPLLQRAQALLRTSART